MKFLFLFLIGLAVAVSAAAAGFKYPSPNEVSQMSTTATPVTSVQMLFRNIHTVQLYFFSMPSVKDVVTKLIQLIVLLFHSIQENKHVFFLNAGTTFCFRFDIPCPLHFGLTWLWFSQKSDKAAEIQDDLLYHCLLFKTLLAKDEHLEAYALLGALIIALCFSVRNKVITFTELLSTWHSKKKNVMYASRVRLLSWNSCLRLRSDIIIWHVHTMESIKNKTCLLH